MTRFRPCIDLHEGRVKQIVGSTLRDGGEAPQENFISDRSAASYAEQYQRDGLAGGHVIMLGPRNEEAALSALRAYPQGLQIGGGIRPDNASLYLGAGASHVIVTSYVFDGEGRFDERKLAALVVETGPQHLVLDLSCKRRPEGWTVAMNRWQLLTNLHVDHTTLNQLAASCDEFLIHAVDVEGKCEGIDEELVAFLGGWGGKPMTYAGGARTMEDLWTVQSASQGRVDVTVGSALDMFGGHGVRYADCLAFNARPSGT